MTLFDRTQSVTNGPITLDIKHDPNAILDYGVDWTDWLQTGETLSASTWAVASPASGVTLGTGSYASTFTTLVTKVWVTAVVSTVTQMRLTNHITTSNSPARQEELSLIINILEK